MRNVPLLSTRPEMILSPQKGHNSDLADFKPETPSGKLRISATPHEV